MINFNAITSAIKTLLEADSDIAAFLASSIAVGEYVNVDPDLTPWIGVYRKSVEYKPRTLGNGAGNQEAELEFTILVQAVSYDSGLACEELIEDYTQKVLDAIQADRTIGGTVDYISEYRVDYSYLETERESVYYQTSIITLTLEAYTS